MTERKKYGWTIKGLLGFIFSPLGFIFLVMGVLFWHFKVGEKPEEPWISCMFLAAWARLFSWRGWGCCFPTFVAGRCCGARMREEIT